MQDHEFNKFSALIADVSAFYRQDVSQFSVSVWWQAMQPYDFEAVSDALSRHTLNPDNGQFMPKPADMVKLFSGRTVDSAQVAWAKVDKAVRAVGPWQSVIFDDPIIHRVIEDMGGWVGLCGKEAEEWPFIGNQFVTRYQGQKLTGNTGDYPPRLIGITEHQNSEAGRASKNHITLIGDRDKAKQVMLGGAEEGRQKITHVAGTMSNLLKALEDRQAKGLITSGDKPS